MDINHFFLPTKNKAIIFLIFPILLFGVSYFFLECPKDVYADCVVPEAFVFAGKIFRAIIAPFINLLSGGWMILGWMFNLIYWYAIASLLSSFLEKKS